MPAPTSQARFLMGSEKAAKTCSGLTKVKFLIKYLLEADLQAFEFEESRG